MIRYTKIEATKSVMTALAMRRRRNAVMTTHSLASAKAIQVELTAVPHRRQVKREGQVACHTRDARLRDDGRRGLDDRQMECLLEEIIRDRYIGTDDLG